MSSPLRYEEHRPFAAWGRAEWRSEEMSGPRPLSAGERSGLHRAAADLHDKFAGVFGMETIEQLLLTSFEELVAQSTTHNQFRLALVERFTRERLQALARAQGHAGRDVPAVLFVCTHNACRSQMALGWFAHLAGRRAVAWSGGSDPVSSIDANAVRAMAEAGIDISTGYSKPWTEEVLLAADVVVTMGCGDACPLFPGKRYQDWEIADPVGGPLEEVRSIRDDIARRVVDLLDHLGITPTETSRLTAQAALAAQAGSGTTILAPLRLRRRWRREARRAGHG
jgi:arsenate reductase